MAENQPVVPHDGEWAVKGEGNQRATSTHRTQREAIETAREIAIKNKSEMFVHRENGQIRERNTYGEDPYPPKG